MVTTEQLTDLSNPAIKDRVYEFALAPFKNPELVPEILPLVIGALVIELYFGRHEDEVLGWNTSVGNAVIWISTGVGLLVTGALDTATERFATYGILFVGSFTAYMDFFHKWSKNTAFHASSPDLIYPLAYVTVVAVKTGMPIELATLKAAALFCLAVFLAFSAIKYLEPKQQKDSFGDLDFS